MRSNKNTNVQGDRKVIARPRDYISDRPRLRPAERRDVSPTITETTVRFDGSRDSCAYDLIPGGRALVRRVR